MIQFIFLAIVLVLNITAQAAVQTDTHTYIVSSAENKLLIIDKITNEEKSIDLDSPQEIVLHNGFGYISNNDSSVFVINLQTNDLLKTINVGAGPSRMIVNDSFGYVMNKWSGTVSVIDLQSNDLTKTVQVGNSPISMTFYKNFGYILNMNSDDVSVIDLRTMTVTTTIPVGLNPTEMMMHEENLYVLNSRTDNVSVIDPKTQSVTQTIQVGSRPYSIMSSNGFVFVVNIDSSSISVIDPKTLSVTQTIQVGAYPIYIDIYGGFGFVLNRGSKTIPIINLETQVLEKTLDLEFEPMNFYIHGQFGYALHHGLKRLSIIDLSRQEVVGNINYKTDEKTPSLHFSNTHVYLGINEVRPLYPSVAFLQRMKEENRLGEFVTLNPKAFDVGEVMPRAYPTQETDLDILPPYVLAQKVFWNLKSGKPIIDPLDILANLTTMMYPQKFLQTEAGRWLRPRLHMAFFQAVWLGQTEKAQTMLRYFIQLGDPVMTKLATYKLVKSSATPSGATNSTSK